jgi:hypothetical protein
MIQQRFRKDSAIKHVTMNHHDLINDFNALAKMKGGMTTTP